MATPDSSAAPVVAAFDVDGTVTTTDCVVPFLRRVGSTPRLVAGLARQARTAVPALVRRDRDTLKELAARATFRGRAVDEVETLAAAFAADVVSSRLRPDAVARLRWHQAAGHRVVFVSASFGCYLRPMAAALDVDDVIATELAASEGTYTGDLDGPNCRGPEKLVRLHRWLDRNAGGRAAVTVWAYGDSAGDRELLADADHAVWATDPIPTIGPAT